METMKSRRLIRMPAVEGKTGKSAPQIYKEMAEGVFPRSVATGPNTRAWVEDEVDEWIAERIAARDDGTDTDLRVINKNIGKGRPRRQDTTRHPVFAEQAADEVIDEPPVRRRRQQSQREATATI